MCRAGFKNTQLVLNSTKLLIKPIPKYARHLPLPTFTSFFLLFCVLLATSLCPRGHGAGHGFTRMAALRAEGSIEEAVGVVGTLLNQGGVIASSQNDF